MYRLLSLSLLLGTVATSYVPASQQPASIFKRAEGGEECEDLSVSSNDGDRMVAVVIDESGSMSSNDPNGDSLRAAKELNDFLIASGEGSKPDLITVIRFSDEGTVEYPLGDPGSADAAIDRIGLDGGGTNIGSGVEAAIDELIKDSNTKDRSALVVFTDGQDSFLSDLVGQIERASNLGIRVSFGFLNLNVGFQDSSILKAVRETRGIYATIADASGATNYVKYAILNGLTTKDNPQGYDERLLAGLAQTYTISGSDKRKLKYRAEKGESIEITVTSISAGSLKVIATMGGSILARSDSIFGSLGFSGDIELRFAAPKNGDIDVQIQAQGAVDDSLFSVLTLSDVPIKNCTISVKPKGMSPGAKAGAAIGTILAVALLGLGAYYLWKHYFQHPLPPPHHPPPAQQPFSPAGPTGAEKAPLATVSVEPLYNVPPTQSLPGGPMNPTVAIPLFIPPKPPGPTSPMEKKPFGDQQVRNFGPPPAQPYGNPANNPTGNENIQNIEPPHDPYQPPPDFDSPDKPDMPDMPDPEMPDPHPDRIPRIKRGKIDKHHHHHYLDPRQECLAEHCEYSQEEHECMPDKDTCPCTCRDPNCPVTKERERVQREKDAIHTLLANTV